MLRLLLLLPLVTTLIVGLSWFGGGYLRFVRYHHHKGIVLPPIAWVRYAIREAWAVLTIGVWHLRAAFADGLRAPAVVSGPPVLCLHGITQTGSNLWGIRRALERRGRATLALSLGRLPPSRHRLADRVAPALRRLADLSPTGRIDVVAHSLGGVLLRIVLTDHPELASRIRRVVTLGSPHAGTAGIRGLPLGRAVQRLGRRSNLLSGLASIPAERVTTVAGIPDLVVYPASTCHLPGSGCVDLVGIGHAGLLTHPDAIAVVVDALCDDASPQ